MLSTLLDRAFHGRDREYDLYECRMCGVSDERPLHVCPVCGSSEIATFRF